MWMRTWRGATWGRSAEDIETKIKNWESFRPACALRSEVKTKSCIDSFTSLGLGLILAILLVYFLMVVLFQSWLDPFIIMTAVPGALVGIVWMLAADGYHHQCGVLMGSIMAVGIATSNSILLVSFANDIRIEKGRTALEGVLESAQTRLRPILMTALAMIIGMLPMALLW